MQSYNKVNNRSKNATENYYLNRGMDLISDGNLNIQVLNDRDLFNRFSNGDEQIDTTSIKPNEFNYGMPMYNGQILNNKKELLSTPYVSEKNDNCNFKSTESSFDKNEMFAELEQDINQNVSNDNLAYNTKNVSDTNNYVCQIEKDIAEYEFDYNKNKTSDFIFDINTSFGIGYIWKSLILLSKNPSTDKLLKFMNVKNKDYIINDMKHHSDVFNDIGEIKYEIPQHNKILNSNYINQIKQIYKINIEEIQSSQKNVIINFIYNFELKIPFDYQPQIVSNFLDGYQKSRINFITMTDVPSAIIINEKNNIILIEIAFAENMILGFIYNTHKKNISELPYDLLITDKKIDHVIKKLTIPKINRTKKSNYGKKFINELKDIHLGEIIYGVLYDIDIDINIKLEITIDNEVSNKKYDIINTVPEVIINHQCYYYIKNNNIKNKLLCNGLINY